LLDPPHFGELPYLHLLERVLADGYTRSDRTGTGTLSRFGERMEFDLKEGFPAVTTKKLAWKAVVGELMWFLEGSSDEQRLRELTYGEDAPETRKTIWTDNLKADYWQQNSYRRGPHDL